jgi:hypothetical protein
MQVVTCFQGKPDTSCHFRLKREGIPTWTDLDDLSVIIPTENGLFVIPMRLLQCGEGVSRVATKNCVRLPASFHILVLEGENRAWKIKRIDW